ATGRHHPGFDLTGDFFPRRSILREIGVIHAVEHESRGLGALVVTTDAVLVGKRIVQGWLGLSVKSGNGTQEAQEAQECQRQISEFLVLLMFHFYSAFAAVSFLMRAIELGFALRG